MVMEMRGLREAVKAPLTALNFDGDWDESAWVRLRSFLYYTSKRIGYSCEFGVYRRRQNRR